MSVKKLHRNASVLELGLKPRLHQSHRLRTRASRIPIGTTNLRLANVIAATCVPQAPCEQGDAVSSHNHLHRIPFFCIFTIIIFNSSSPCIWNSCIVLPFTRFRDIRSDRKYLELRERAATGPAWHCASGSIQEHQNRTPQCFNSQYQEYEAACVISLCYRYSCGCHWQRRQSEEGFSIPRT